MKTAEMGVIESASSLRVLRQGAPRRESIPARRQRKRTASENAPRQYRGLGTSSGELAPEAVCQAGRQPGVGIPAAARVHQVKVDLTAHGPAARETVVRSCAQRSAPGGRRGADDVEGGRAAAASDQQVGERPQASVFMPGETGAGQEREALQVDIGERPVVATQVGHETQRRANREGSGDLPAVQVGLARVKVRVAHEHVGSRGAGRRFDRRPPGRWLARPDGRRQEEKSGGPERSQPASSACHFWTLTSVAVTAAAVRSQLVSVPRTWTWAPTITCAWQSTALPVCPTHLNVAAAALTATNAPERLPFTSSRKLVALVLP